MPLIIGRLATSVCFVGAEFLKMFHNVLEYVISRLKIRLCGRGLSPYQTTRFHPGPDHQCRVFQTFLLKTYMFVLLVNLLTYLLYLLTDSIHGSKFAPKISEVSQKRHPWPLWWPSKKGSLTYPTISLRRCICLCLAGIKGVERCPRDCD